MSDCALWLLAVVAACCLGACNDGQQVAYSHFVSVNPKGWDCVEECTFDPAPMDTTLPASTLYDVVLTVRHNPTFNYRLLWLSLEQISGPETSRCDTIAIPITDASGRWLGRGSVNLYEVADTIMRAVRIPSNYSINISHAMDAESVEGINNIGVTLLKH